MSQNHHNLPLIPKQSLPKMEVSHFTIILLLTLTFFLLPPSSKSSPYYTTLVFKTCATSHQLHQSQSHSQTLFSLFQQLTAQSSQTKFFRTTELLNNDKAISGLFQCRDDMTTEDCFTCVNSLPRILSNTLCAEFTSARVQLEGCYIKYETENLISEATPSDDESEINDYNLLHKYCEGKSTEGNFEFGELMEEAFMALQSGIVKGHGFYRTNYRSVELVAQCEGGSDACECGECVSDAVRVAKEECGGSVSAEIYLDKCFISYAYHSEADGIPGNSGQGASRKNSTKKLAAIVVGGAALLVMGFLFLSLLGSRLKKHDYE